jgi:Di-haem oxidoreductase, putative peroxidase
MTKNFSKGCRRLAVAAPIVLVVVAVGQNAQIGREVAIPSHLADGEEFNISLPQLIQFGQQLFNAKFTVQEGAGRPRSKGTGAPISDSSSPLLFPRNFDRLSSPEANSCQGCHNAPASGGGGDRVTEVFVLAQRFDHLTFDHNDGITLRGALDESGKFVTLDDATNDRKTIGMNGSGFLEMVARQMTADLQAIAATTAPGMSRPLVTKGVSFGIIVHDADGTWNTSQVMGLPAPSLKTSGTTPPSLIILPYHQAGAVVSIRQFTNNAMNHHHGMQSEERFGLNTDPDGDGFTNELTVADVTAISLFQATLAVPGQVIPDNPAIEQAIFNGKRLFDQIRCNSCHMDALPLDRKGWIYSEPSPYNPAGTLQVGLVNYPLTAPPLSVDLTSHELPGPRLQPNQNGVVMVQAYTDLRLHDISATSNPATDPECEPLDQNQSAGTPGFFKGNCKFITRKLWGFYNQGGAFMHHGKFTTAREAVEAHNGEALASRQAFDALASDQQNEVIEFLRSLQVLPPGTKSLVVDEHGHPTKAGPPATSSTSDP